MAQIIPFTASALEPFQFQPTLDGQTYTALVKWNFYAQRYYVEIYTLGGELVLAIPMVGSPLDYDISLTETKFTSKMVFREPSQQFEITP